MKEWKNSGAVECFIWEDSHTIDGWQNPDEIALDGCKILTIGFVVKEDECFIAVSPSRTEAGDTCSTITVPKINLLFRKKLIPARDVSGILIKVLGEDF